MGIRCRIPTESDPGYPGAARLAQKRHRRNVLYLRRCQKNTDPAIRRVRSTMPSLADDSLMRRSRAAATGRSSQGLGVRTNVAQPVWSIEPESAQDTRAFLDASYVAVRSSFTNVQRVRSDCERAPICKFRDMRTIKSNWMDMISNPRVAAQRLTFTSFITITSPLLLVC